MYFIKSPKQNQLNTRVISGNLNSVPWDECSRIYREAADLAEANTLAAVKDAYDKAYQSRRQEALRLAGISEEESTYEGDLNLDYQPPQLGGEDLRKLRAKAGNEAVREYFVKPYHIRSWGIKLLDQIVAEFSTHKLNSLGSGGTISGVKYLQDNLDPKSPRDMGIYRFLMLDSRSDYLDKMGSSEAKKYCTLVPLILYAHKLYHNVDYSRWERETLHYVVNESLREAMLTEVPQDLSTDRLLELRDMGLMQRGQRRNPQTTYSLYHLGDTEIGHCNGLVKIMLLQTWAAHPSNRTKYMVLDPLNWDRVPTPLVDTNVFREPPKPAQAAPVAPLSTSHQDAWM